MLWYELLGSLTFLVNVEDGESLNNGLKPPARIPGGGPGVLAVSVGIPADGPVMVAGAKETARLPVGRAVACSSVLVIPPMYIDTQGGGPEASVGIANPGGGPVG